ncbi:MAG: hypothetical protein IPN69_08480 [Acidobacteria bacterium]|nr:hypothetical protein [Acidobacteriota bacterium]
MQVNGGSLVLGRVTGVFAQGESFTIAAVVQGSIISAAVESGASSVEDDAAYRGLAADDRRADILPPPGSGPIRGVWLYRDVVYAFRDNADGTACNLWKKSASGWVQVPFLYEVTFSAGGGATPADGATLTQGGVTATIRRVVRRTGAWGGTAAGTFVISAPSGGNFAAGAATATGGVTITLAGIQTAITRPPGGRYEFVNHNFTGSTDTLRVYGCDGVGTAFEFDGTYIAPIHTGMATDTPSHVAAHKGHLFLSFRGSLQHSSIGFPLEWSPVTGANELGIGDDITDLLPQPGDAGGGAMSIFSVNSTHVLYGSSAADWQLALPIPPSSSDRLSPCLNGESNRLQQPRISAIFSMPPSAE